MAGGSQRQKDLHRQSSGMYMGWLGGIAVYFKYRVVHVCAS